MLIDWRLKILKEIPSNLKHPKATFLIKGQILPRGGCRTHQQHMLSAFPQLILQLPHETLPITLPTQLCRDSDIENLVLLIALPTHHCRTKQLVTYLQRISYTGRIK